MSDETKQPDEQDAVLGSLGEGPRDTQLGGLKPARSRRKLPELTSPGERAPQQIPSAPADERLKLPRGAFVALRKSGGLRFSSREVVVFRDGRVRATVLGAVPGGADEPRRLLADEVTTLYQRIAASDIKKLPARSGQQSPDAFAYELVARVGRNVYAVEFFDPDIPESLEPIIRDLLALIPNET
jgi:hypothetical protein